MVIGGREGREAGRDRHDVRQSRRARPRQHPPGIWWQRERRWDCEERKAVRAGEAEISRG